MHPGMQAIWGPLGQPPLASPPPETAHQRAKRVAYQGARSEAIAEATPAIGQLLSAFLERAADLPKIEFTGSQCRIVTVKSLRFSPGYRYEGDPRGHGWFVSTPQHPVTGLAVRDDGSVFAAEPPNCFQIVVDGPDIAGDLEQLGLHTHGSVSLDAESLRLVPKVLESLLVEALREPVGLRRRTTRREMKQAKAETYRWRDEQTFGPGGIKAYRKRMYGK
jgi:hypothetical protein